MNKEIGYTGLSSVPSDYDVQDGQLAVSVNMINEGRGMEAIFPAKDTGIKLMEGQKLLYVHSNSTYKHFIIGDSNGLHWAEKGTPLARFTADIDAGHIASITSVGNTLIISVTGYTGEKETTNGLNYFLWTENRYKLLGMDVPDFPVWWRLATDGISSSEKTTVDMTAYDDEAYTNNVFAALNPLVRQAKEDNKFIMPFFVRYAVRLFDGSLSKHSAPVLMIPVTQGLPCVDVDTSSWEVRPPKDKTYATGFQAFILRTALYYYVRQESLDKLKDWSDVISSIDIFVSDQIYTYDTEWKRESDGHRTTRAEGVHRGDDVNVAQVTPFSVIQHHYVPGGRLDTTSQLYERYSQRWLLSDIEAIDKVNLPSLYMRTPSVNTKLYKSIREESHFYLAKSIPIRDLKGGEWDELVMDDGTLSSITAREAMTDDYNSHDRLYPKVMFVYNNRLNLAGLSRKIYKGYEPTSIMPLINGHVTRNTDGTYTDDSSPSVYKIVVFIKENGSEYVAFGDLSYSMDASGFPFYVFYPNLNAYKAIIWRQSEGGKVTYYNLPLSKHAFLNGAYWFNDFKEPQPDSSIDRQPSDYETIIPMPNQIYTSAVNDPFYFPVANMLEVGTGEILSLATMTKPVSTGQFGEYPLYVFTTEGVWGLQVGNDGSYVAKQPVSRDICQNTESIAMIDNAVLFSTGKNIMMLQGGTAVSITDVLEGPAFDVAALPHFDKLLDNSGLMKGNIPLTRFETYIKACKMAYDYVNQRLYLFNPAYSYAYIFSFKTKVWGMAACNFNGCVQSYPDSFVITKESGIVNVSDIDYSRPVNGMIVTRPLKFEANDILKTLTTAIHRGKFGKGDVRGAFYGSRDLIHWHLVGSSVNHYFRNFHGTGFKYFRFVINCTFDRDESLSGTSVDFTPRQNNKLR